MVKVLIPKHDGKPDMLHVFEDEGEHVDYYHFVDTDCPCFPVLGESNSGEYVVTHRSFTKSMEWNG